MQPIGLQGALYKYGGTRKRLLSQVDGFTCTAAFLVSALKVTYLIRLSCRDGVVDQARTVLRDTLIRGTAFRPKPRRTILVGRVARIPHSITFVNIAPCGSNSVLAVLLDTAGPISSGQRSWVELMKRALASVGSH